MLRTFSILRNYRHVLIFCTVIFTIILVPGFNNSYATTVALWHLDEGVGTTTKNVITNSDDPIIGPTWTSGFYGNALKFDGFDDRVEVDNPFSGIQNTFSIELYFWSDNLLDGRYLFAQSAHMRDVVVAMPRKDIVNFSMRDIYGTPYELKTDPIIKNNEWNYVKATYDGSKMQLFVNNSLQKSLDVVADITWSENYRGTYIGWHYNNSDFSFNGIIDEVKITDNLNPVPEPSSFLLMGLGLLSTIFIFSKNKLKKI